jgi:hypothetical protein
VKHLDPVCAHRSRGRAILQDREDARLAGRGDRASREFPDRKAAFQKALFVYPDVHLEILRRPDHSSLVHSRRLDLLAILTPFVRKQKAKTRVGQVRKPRADLCRRELVSKDPTKHHHPQDDQGNADSCRNALAMREHLFCEHH